jgi:hypothetical protein
MTALSWVPLWDLFFTDQNCLTQVHSPFHEHLALKHQATHSGAIHLWFRQLCRAIPFGGLSWERHCNLFQLLPLGQGSATYAPLAKSDLLSVFAWHMNWEWFLNGCKKLFKRDDILWYLKVLWHLVSVSIVKFYWNRAELIHLFMFCGYFFATTAALNSCQRDHMTQKAKHCEPVCLQVWFLVIKVLKDRILYNVILLISSQRLLNSNFSNFCKLHGICLIMIKWSNTYCIIITL